ncbi:MAG: pseudouridine synthase [Erysipelotrichaceae bacterium]
MRLDKALADLNLGSRKEVKLLIRKGKVCVNGLIIKDDDHHIDIDHDVITLDDERLAFNQVQYFMLYKPIGSICENRSKQYPSVLEYIKEPLHAKTQTVGRLDVDTEGVLLIMSDGTLAHHLLAPKSHCSKIYHLSLEKSFDLNYLVELQTGIVLSDGLCQAAIITLIDETHMLMEISEGRTHQVKRMMHACDNEVIALKRIQFGPLTLGDLKPGEYRALSLTEIEALKSL